MNITSKNLPTMIAAAFLMLGACAGGPEEQRRDKVETADVEVRFGLTTPRLAPAIGEAESKALLAGFDWQETVALPEDNSDGTPALHYVLIYVKNRQQVSDLEVASIHHAYSPLFGQERAIWRGQRGMMTPSGDGKGVFAFSFLPGRVYNMIRQKALADEILFDAVILREAPSEVLNSDGTLSYDVMAEAAFRYLGQAPPPQLDPRLGTTQQGLVILTARKALKLIAEAAEEIARAVHLGLGNRDRDGLVLGLGAAGIKNLFVTIDVRDTDAEFSDPVPADPAAPDPSSPMIRAWGAKRGRVVRVPGVRVSVWSRGDGTVLWLPTLFEGNTNTGGSTRIEIADNRNIEAICIAGENDAVEVTEMLTEVEICDFTFDEQPIFTSSMQVTAKVQHPYFNAVAQVTEARSYLREIVGYTPSKATLLVGPIADLMGSIGSSAFAPCLGFPNVTADLLVTSTLGFLSAVSPAAAISLALVTPILAVDIVLGADRVKTSRGIITHEYGHYAMCSMLYDSAAHKISTVWTSAVIDRLSAGASPSANAQASYVIEAFADFLASQVVSGVNYATLPAVEDASGMNYCLANSSDCIEHNEAGTATFDQQLTRVLTTLNDAFDGHDVPTGFTDDVPGDGGVWARANGQVIYSSAQVGDAADEHVALPGSALFDLVGRLESLREDAFMKSLATTMSEHGFSWCQSCEVFALHDSGLPSSPTLQDKYDRCLIAPISNWVEDAPDPQDPLACNFTGCPDGLLLNIAGATRECVPCPEGLVTIDQETCVPCPAGTEVVNNECVSCDGGPCDLECPERHERVGGNCVECAWPEVTVENQCVSCEVGLLRQRNTCVSECSLSGDEIQIIDGVCVAIIN